MSARGISAASEAEFLPKLFRAQAFGMFPYQGDNLLERLRDNVLRTVVVKTSARGLRRGFVTVPSAARVVGCTVGCFTPAF